MVLVHICSKSVSQAITQGVVAGSQNWQILVGNTTLGPVSPNV